MATLGDALWLSQRVMWTTISDPHRFEQLIDLFKDNRAAVDDVWIFTENDGQDFRYINIEEVRRRAPLVKGQIERLRQEGFKASINVLNTIGHSDYAEPFLEPLPWGGIVGPDGSISTCCSCPRQPQFREYITAKYIAYAECDPEWIWVDDDVLIWSSLESNPRMLLRSMS